MSRGYKINNVEENFVKEVLNESLKVNQIHSYPIKILCFILVAS